MPFRRRNAASPKKSMPFEPDPRNYAQLMFRYIAT